jgi:hypothetical protein
MQDKSLGLCQLGQKLTWLLMNSVEKIVLQVSGNVPSFKNKKRAILDRNTGKMRTMTEAKTQKRMEEIIQSFVFQLCCATQTTFVGISTEEQARFLIASLLPEDDSWQWIPELHISCAKVKRGEEGGEMIIEKL